MVGGALIDEKKGVCHLGIICDVTIRIFIFLTKRLESVSILLVLGPMSFLAVCYLVL